MTVRTAPHTVSRHRRSPLSGKGFALLELMIVVAIVGILATIATPSYMNYLVRARAAELMVQYDALREHAIIEASNRGLDLCNLPASVKPSDLLPSERLANRYALLFATRASNPNAGDYTLLLGVKASLAQDGAMHTAVARAFLQELDRVGMLRSATQVSSLVLGAAFVTNVPCGTVAQQTGPGPGVPPTVQGAQNRPLKAPGPQKSAPSGQGSQNPPGAGQGAQGTQPPPGGSQGTQPPSGGAQGGQNPPANTGGSQQSAGSSQSGQSSSAGGSGSQNPSSSQSSQSSSSYSHPGNPWWSPNHPNNPGQSHHPNNGNNGNNGNGGNKGNNGNKH